MDVLHGNAFHQMRDRYFPEYCSRIKAERKEDEAFAKAFENCVKQSCTYKTRLAELLSANILPAGSYEIRSLKEGSDYLNNCVKILLNTDGNIKTRLDPNLCQLLLGVKHAAAAFAGIYAFSPEVFDSSPKFAQRHRRTLFAAGKILHKALEVLMSETKFKEYDAQLHKLYVSKSA
jgi:hypothetical protein